MPPTPRRPGSEADDRRKGQTVGIDFALGLAIFIITVSIVIFYATNLGTPSSPFSNQVVSSTTQAAETLSELNSWTVYSVPVTLNASSAYAGYPVELDFVYPSTVDRDSPLVTRQRREIASQHHFGINQTVFLANLTSGVRRYSLVYTLGTGLDDRTYTTLVNRSGDSIWNSDINATFDSDGIESLVFDGSEELVQESDLQGIDVLPAYRDGPLRTRISYDDVKDQFFRIFGKTTRIRVQHRGDPLTYELNLSSDFDQLYVSNGDQTIDLSGNGTFFNDSTEFADLNYTSGTTYGIALMGEGMNLTVRRDETSGALTANLSIPANGSYLILPHEGDYTAVSDERDLFFDPPDTTVSLVQEHEGFSQRKLDAFQAQSSDTVQAQLQLTDLGYNISINDSLRLGQEVPGSQQVAVLEYPVTILDRWANQTIRTFRMAVWL
jgi:hypothetical protein